MLNQMFKYVYFQGKGGIQLIQAKLQRKCVFDVLSLRDILLTLNNILKAKIIWFIAFYEPL